jgi:hypothetical protein
VNKLTKKKKKNSIFTGAVAPTEVSLKQITVLIQSMSDIKRNEFNRSNEKKKGKIQRKKEKKKKRAQRKRRDSFDSVGCIGKICDDG